MINQKGASRTAIAFEPQQDTGACEAFPRRMARTKQKKSLLDQQVAPITNTGRIYKITNQATVGGELQQVHGDESFQLGGIETEGPIGLRRPAMRGEMQLTGCAKVQSNR
jgi:hypothetical protein